MKKGELTGKVQTVSGLIDPDALGVTLLHEHLLFSWKQAVSTPTEPTEQELAQQPVSLENLWWVRRHSSRSLDNATLGDEQMIIDEAIFYKRAGGDTIVEQTGTSSLGLDALGLKRIARGTGLNVVMGTGFYEVYSPEGYETSSLVGRSEEDLAEEKVRDITVGVGNTGVRAGFIGEIGLRWPFTDLQRTVVRAAVRAQRRTGAALYFHIPVCASNYALAGQKDHEDVMMDVIQTLHDAGADFSRTVLGHIDICCFTPAFRRKLAETGCYLGYDHFGMESFFDLDLACMLDWPNDAQKVNEIMQLIDEGFLNQIVISHDIALKYRLRRYGGEGYAHILTSIVPLMRLKGMSEEQLHTLLVENPKRVLPFAPAKD